MALNKKIAIPLAIIILASMAGGGWYLWQKKQAAPATEQKAAQGKQLYTCSMHPFIIKDKPGTCPICGMELIKKIEGAAGGEMTAEQKQQADMLGHVSLSPTQRVMANVATVAVKQTALNKEINAVGIVQFDQARQAKVTAWIAGRIDQLHVNKVGDIVSKDKPVAEVYSPDLVATQQEYLLAVKSRDQLKNSPVAAISQNGEGLVASAKQRLMLFGVKESQIAELEKAGKPNIKLPIYTPLSGVVIEKMMQQGQYVNTGEVLFNIADLSKVWVEVEVYENEFPNIHIGQQVEIRSQSFPGKPFSGKIAYIYPFLDPKTRTVKARVEMDNPGMRLKPDMFVNAIIKVPLGTSIVVPVTAVIDTGKRQVVWVEGQPGMFEPRDVQVGQKTDDKVQILSGLKAGEKVAVSGGYLIDSESQLKGGGGQDHSKHTGGSAKPATQGQTPAGTQQPSGGHEGHGAPATQQPPAKKGTLKMDDMKM
ncbi:efflux RND transporter periplasmic adaptor subunit [Geobacter hydrogenophilus]|uniref:RND transporter n=1 Tax=Geobacter hydrogenophilus TaxID=40983 RepID=A0A9W6G301_9BACT|nr:efflux RND transporter periplasmic adaptor subunit [Geobacter hydrogenophilus]MBT0895277.1 efflux RND transporter periplasmic adaptor subunit [Geobacter hydrogenophilus]GLI39506.1 RND transporter [Geobacter hydrogenophilus]